MARLYSCGFELQSAAAGVEFSKSGLNGGGISTTTKRSGAASMQINVSASFSWFGHAFKSAVSNSEAFVRIYVNFTTLPGVTTEIISAYDSVGVSQQACICVTSAGVIQLRQTTPAGTQIGSNGPTLSTGVWYRIEWDVSGGSGNAIMKAYVDGVNFASSTTATVGTFDAIYLGNPGTSATMNLFYDDWAINDTSGANQTGLPGAGQIEHLKPDSAGDNNGWLVQVGGTAGSSNNFTRVNETTPDDATSYNGDTVLNDVDDHNLAATSSNIASGDTINVVQVGVRYRAIVAATEAAFQLRIKKTSGGTVSSSSAITPNSTSWNTHANAAPQNYALTLYNDPDSNPWTKTNLDTTQIGYIISSTNTNAANISTVWLLIDSTPVILGNNNSTKQNLMLLGVGT